MPVHFQEIFGGEIWQFFAEPRRSREAKMRYVHLGSGATSSDVRRHLYLRFMTFLNAMKTLRLDEHPMG
jgi:hypothetical protein